MFFGAILPIESIGISTGMATGASSVVPSATMYGLFLHMKPEGRERNHPMTDEAKALVERLKDEKRAWSFQSTATDRLDAIDLIETQAREIERLREALGWYEKQANDCRKITREGDDARYALDRDGGERARAALAGDSHDA